MSQPNLKDYILGGSKRRKVGLFTEVVLVILIALLLRFGMIITEVRLFSLPVIDPILKSLHVKIEKMMRDDY